MVDKGLYSVKDIDKMIESNSEAVLDMASGVLVNSYLLSINDTTLICQEEVCNERSSAYRVFEIDERTQSEKGFQDREFWDKWDAITEWDKQHEQENGKRNFAYFLVSEPTRIIGTTLGNVVEHDFTEIAHRHEVLMLEQVGSTFDIAQIGTKPEFNIDYASLDKSGLIELSKGEYDNLLQLQQTVDKLQELANLNAAQYYISAEVVKTITDTLRTAKDAYLVAAVAAKEAYVTEQTNDLEQTNEQPLALDNLITDYKDIRFPNVYDPEACISPLTIDEETLLAIADRANFFEKTGVEREDAADNFSTGVIYNFETDEVTLIIEVNNPTAKLHGELAVVPLSDEEAQAIKSSIERCAIDEGLTMEDYAKIAAKEEQRPKQNNKVRTSMARE